MARVPALLAALSFACGPTARPPADVTALRSAELGWVGVAPAATADAGLPGWLPVDAGSTVVIPGPGLEGVSAGAELVGVPRTGAPVALRYQGPASIRYGCDEGQLEISRLTGSGSLPPGAVWVLPATAPASLSPVALAVVPGEVGAGRRVWRAGAYALELERRDDTHATLTVRSGAAVLGAPPAEKHFMEGAEREAIDLTRDDEIGMPMAAAAYSLAGGAAALFVFTRQGYEGVQLDTLLVGPGLGLVEGRPAGAYLYQCAF